MSGDPIETELSDLTRRAGPRRPGAFERATELRQLLRTIGRADNVDRLVGYIEQSTLRLDAPDLRAVARASFRLAPYGDALLEDRLDACALDLAAQLTEQRERPWRDPGKVAPPSQRTMQRRRQEAVVRLAAVMRDDERHAEDGGVTQAPRRQTIPGDRSEFLGDVSLADGSLIEPGASFEKQWRLRNAGTVPWHDRFLSRVGAAGDGKTSPLTPARVPIPDTAPGESVVITIPVRAPELPGTYQVHWKMTDSHGQLFFPDRYKRGIWFSIVVPGTN